MQNATRRTFLKTTAATALGVAVPAVVPGTVFGKDAPSERLNLAVVGVSGRGGNNLHCVKSQNIVALCDVDTKLAAKAYDAFPNAKKFQDFRKMFDAMESGIDGVVISTPDHAHFHPAWWAMQRGKHVYLEKPMAHSVWEVHQLMRLAAEKKVATQLGVQRHELPGLRQAVEIVKSGVLGEVKECHSWIASSRGMPAALKTGEQTPATLDWDLWLGPAAERPYSSGLAPYKWRFWWDFGTGEAGNWGCHILDIPYWALNLKHATRISGSGPEPDAERTPTAMTTRLEFPAEGSRGPVTLHWYQGQPPILKELGLSGKGMNNLFVGSKGTLLCGFDKAFKLLPEKDFADFKEPSFKLPKTPGFYQEWFDACKGGPAACCNFNYSGPMAESVLLANVAYRVQGSFDWNAAELKATGNAAVEKYLRTPFRKGWEIS